MLTLILCDHNPALVRAWREQFSAEAEVEVRHGDLTDAAAHAYVPAANSFGEMGGGVDLALRERFEGVETRVMDAIAALGGALPVGEALVVETGDLDVPYLVVAPTMAVPMNVSLTDHAYRALLAALRAWTRHPDGAGSTLAVSGLCTGVGRMEPERAAAQMHRAWREFREGSG